MRSPLPCGFKWQAEHLVPVSNENRGIAKASLTNSKATSEKEKVKIYFVIARKVALTEALFDRLIGLAMAESLSNFDMHDVGSGIINNIIRFEW